MQRLLTRAQFQAVLAADIAAKTPHFVLHRKPLHGHNDLTPLFSKENLWLGALVPKRWARRAVTRNSIKRQIYAIGAVCFSADFAPAAFVVRLRRDFPRAEYVSATSAKLTLAVRAELQHLFEAAVQAVGKKP